MIRLLVPIVAVAMLGACGSPPARLPPALEQARLADKDALRALRAGDARNAQVLLERSLSLHRSVDDVDGAASALISLATLSHRMHDDEAALKLLDRVLLDQPGVYPPEWHVTAAFRKAVILADQGRTGDAEQVLALADRQCELRCPLRYGIEVLKARLALLRGDAAAALQLAQPVASAWEAGKEEQANALRIAASAEEGLARYDAALRHYRAALELDKSLGFSARIEDDLNGMARVLKQLGRTGEAESHARRAAIVHEATRGNAPATIPAVP